MIVIMIYKHIEMDINIYINRNIIHKQQRSWAGSQFR